MIGFSTRLSYALRCFFAILFQAEIPQDIGRELIKPAPQPAPPRTSVSAAGMNTKVDTRAEESVDR
ncbi:MAG: hypothetical protein WA655_11090, partial [Candidatus Korobacteraceae bacterium]